MSAFGSHENAQQNINEEKAEEEAMNKSLHQPMKSWFNALTSSKFKEKYGPFPSFWQDMGTYPHLRLVKKLYLKTSDMGAGEYDIDEIEMKVLSVQAEAITPTALASTNNGEIAIKSENGSTTDGSSLEGDNKPKKRKSRWGGEDSTNTNATAESKTVASTSSEDLAGGVAESKEATTNADSSGDGKKRKSRFTTASGTASTSESGEKTVVPLSQESMQQSLIFQMQLKQINDRLPNIANEAAAIELDPNRSPSPPPKYDMNGKRTNKREDRMREALTQERNDIISSLIKLNPNYQPPADYIKPKPIRRIYIPVKEYPQYNFIGLVKGPRGNTQKKMEQETNCKISIRGKGSLKDGSKGRAKQPDDDDELHVHITGETEEGLEMACKLVEELLTPVDDDKNEHKQKQLKELALINGTLREEDFCSVCGEKGHRQYECPHRAKTFKAAGIKCAICGDMSHPTRDCPLKQDGMDDANTIDSEYNSFLSELGGGSSGGVATDSSGSSKKTSSGITPQIIEAEYVDPNPKPKPMVPIVAAPGTQVVTEVVWDAAGLSNGSFNPPGVLATATTVPSDTQPTAQLPAVASNMVPPPLPSPSHGQITQPPMTQLVSQPYWNPTTGQITYVQTHVPVTMPMYQQPSAQPGMPTPQAPAPPLPPGLPPSS